MGVTTNTTYFVGGHYEVTNGTVTKYYYAGSQRIAMRQNGTLNFILGDHLGSTSLVADANGVVISETRYKAWGEVRFAAGGSPTKYTFTGQYSYTSDFGLMFYNARWLDVSLGRFAQADSTIPSMQEYDRYSYVGNNPLRYTDPTGRCIDGTTGDVNMGGYPYGTSGVCAGSMVKEKLASYGITATNGTTAQNRAVLQAAQLAGNKIASVIGNGISAQEAFKQAHGNISITFGVEGMDGCQTDDHAISCGTTYDYLVQTMIHEFGHVFDNQFKDITGRLASDYPDTNWNLTYDGYKCDTYPCIQHPAKDSIYGTRGLVEDFADMYLNWVLDMNPAYPDNGFTNEGMGGERRDMMNNTYYNPALPRGMPVWLQLMGLR